MRDQPCKKMRLWLMAALAVLFVQPALAQDGAFISLSTDTTSLQTGQIYEVRVVVENVMNLWVTSFEISYDPRAIYIMGTRAGSPVQPGPLLPANQILAPRNRVVRDGLRYTVSLLAPAEPISGTGFVAVFRIAPLTPGSTRLVFRQAELTAVSFQQTSEGRIAGDPQAIAFTPVLLDLSVQGDPVEPPPEVTATPPPTTTPILESTEEAEATTLPEIEPTLVNITREPAQATPAAASPQGETSPLLIGALVLLVVSGVGLVALVGVYRRRYRR